MSVDRSEAIKRTEKDQVSQRYAQADLALLCSHLSLCYYYVFPDWKLNT